MTFESGQSNIDVLQPCAELSKLVHLNLVSRQESAVACGLGLTALLCYIMSVTVGLTLHNYDNLHTSVLLIGLSACKSIFCTCPQRFSFGDPLQPMGVCSI